MNNQKKFISPFEVPLQIIFFFMFYMFENSFENSLTLLVKEQTGKEFCLQYGSIKETI